MQMQMQKRIKSSTDEHWPQSKPFCHVQNWKLKVAVARMLENAYYYEIQCASFMTCVHVNAVCSLCVWANVEPSISLLPNC